MSNHFFTQDRGTLLIDNWFTSSTAPLCSPKPDHPAVSIQLIDCTFDKITALEHVVALNIITDGNIPITLV